MGVLTSNKEGTVICEIEGQVLGGMQFGVLVEVLFFELDGRVLGGMQFGVLVEVPLCKIDGQVLGGGAVLQARGHVVWGAGGGAALRD